jgi:hypothetical protein
MEMDVTALALQNATCCINKSQREIFDSVFQHYVVGDEGGFYRKALDLVVGNGTMPPVAMAIVYGILFPASHFDEEDDLEMMLALSVALLVKNVRGDVIKRQRLNWHSHVKSLKHQGLFQINYRMSFSAFSKLLNLLREDLRVDAKKSRNRTSNQDPIGPDMILYCTLHYLSGGSYLDVMIHTGISRVAFYSCVYWGMDAICKCPDL